MFVATVIGNGGAICLFVAGIFYALSLHIHGSDTPVRSINVPAAVSKVTVSGIGRDRFFVSVQQTFSGMTAFWKKCLNGKITPNSNRSVHDTSESLYSKFLIEMSAKNKAYAFILSRGLLSEFTEFSRACFGECQSVESKVELNLKNC